MQPVVVANVEVQVGFIYLQLSRVIDSGMTKYSQTERAINCVFNIVTVRCDLIAGNCAHDNYNNGQ